MKINEKIGVVVWVHEDPTPVRRFSLRIRNKCTGPSPIHLEDINGLLLV